MNKKVNFLIITILLLVIITFIYLSLTITRNKASLISILKEHDIELTTDKNINVVFFPIPSFDMENISLKYKYNQNPLVINSEKLRFIISLNSLIFGKLKFSNVIFGGSTSLISDKSIGSEDLAALLKFDKKGVEINEIEIDELNVINGKYRYNKIRNFKINSTDSFELSAEIFGKTGYTKLDLISNKDNLKIDLLNSNYSFAFTGLVGEKKLEGESSLKIIDTKKFMQNHHDGDMFNILKGQKLTVNSKINLGLNKLEISEFNVESNFIDSKGKANIIIEDKTIMSNIEFSQLNINKPDKIDKINQVSDDDHYEYSYKQQNEYNILNMIFDSNMKHKISFNFITGKIMNLDLLNSRIDFEATKDKFILLPSNINLGKMSSNFYGVELNNGYRSAFDGKINLTGTDVNEFLSLLNIKTDQKTAFNLDTNIFISPKDIKIYDSEFKSDDKYINGKAILKYDSKTPSYDISITSKNIDLDSENIKKFIENFFGEKTSNSFQELRGIDYELVADVNLFDFKIIEQNVKHIGFELNVGKAFSSLSHFNIESDLLDFKSNFSIGARSYRPETDLEISGNKIDLNYIKKIIQSNDNFSEFKFQSFFDYLKNLYIDSSFIVNIKSITLDESLYENLDLNFNFKDDQIIFSKLQLDLYGGNFIMTPGSNIMINPFIVNMAFGANNISIEEIPNAKNKGYVSASGKIHSTGDNILELTKNLNSNILFATKKLTIEGIDLSDIINATSSSTKLNRKEIVDIINNFRKNRTLLENLTCATSIDKSVLNLYNCKFNSDRIAGAIGGSVNIIDYQTNIETKIVFIPKPKEKALNMKLVVNDSIYQPNITLDSKEIEEYLK